MWDTASIDEDLCISCDVLGGSGEVCEGRLESNLEMMTRAGGTVSRTHIS